MPRVVMVIRVSRVTMLRVREGVVVLDREVTVLQGKKNNRAAPESKDASTVDSVAAIRADELGLLGAIAMPMEIAVKVAIVR